MATSAKAGFCKKCDSNRKLERPRANHILHLILTILTAGLWIIVWILVGLQIGGWRCSTCGSTKVARAK